MRIQRRFTETRSRRHSPNTWGALAWLVLALVFASGCEQLKELRDLRDQARSPAAGYRPGASGVDAGVEDDVVVPPRDAGRDPDWRDLGSEVDGGFFPVEDTGPDAPVFEEAPTIFDVFPAVVPTTGGTIVTVQGSRFTWDTEVRLGGQPVAHVDVIDQYELLFMTDEMEAGTYDLKLATPGGTAVFTAAFTAVEPTRVDRVEPAEGPITGGTPVVVYGAGFSRSTRFLVGDREALDVRIVDADEAEMIVPPSDTAGPVSIVAMSNEIGFGVDLFTYYSEPRLDALVPSHGRSSGGESVRVVGAGVDESCAVVFGTLSAPVTRDPLGPLVVTTPGGPAGRVDVALDCGVRGADRIADAFEWVTGEPGFGLRAVVPDTGFRAGGQTVAILGDQLQDVVSVRFGDTEVVPFEREDRVVRVVAPATSPGTVDVTAETAGESDTLPEAYHFVAQPRADLVSPSVGPTAGGWTVVVEGSDLGGVEIVWVDGRSVVPTAVSDSTVTFETSATAGGPADILFEVAGLRVDTGLDLTFADDFSVDRFTPTSGSVAGGTRLYLIGDGFTRSCVVTIDGVPVATDRLGASLLAARTPPHEEGPAEVGLTGCGDGWVGGRTFNYVDPTRLPGGVHGGTMDGVLNVAVVEAGTGAPIEGATVMVDIREDSPFVASTDASGAVTFTDDRLRGPHSVTAFAPERSAETYQNVDVRNVTFVLDQLPSPPCDPATDPDGCAPPPPPPTGEIIGFLTGLDKVGDPPPGATVAARIETTRYSAGYGNPNPGVDSILYENGAFTITTRLGEMALVAQCGWFLEDGTFVPIRLGITRGIFIRESDPAYRTAVDCNIDLEEQVTFKLSNAPALVTPTGEEGEATYPAYFEIAASWDLGAEGHLETLPPVRSTQALFTGGAYPALTGPLEDVSVTFTAGAYDQTQRYPYALTYARVIRQYDRVVTFPDMMPIPTVITPNAGEAEFRDYVEWDYPESARVPDFYYFSISAIGENFPRWVVYVPGHERSLNLADFPAYHEAVGTIRGPGDTGNTMYILLRAVDANAFDYGGFDRYALRSNNWNAMALNYVTVWLGSEVEEPDESVGE